MSGTASRQKSSRHRRHGYSPKQRHDVRRILSLLPFIRTKLLKQERGARGGGKGTSAGGHHLLLLSAPGFLYTLLKAMHQTPPRSLTANKCGFVAKCLLFFPGTEWY